MRKQAVVKPGGIIEIRSPELEVGSTVDVIVLVDTATQELIPDPTANWTRKAEITEIFDEMDRDRHYRGITPTPVED